VERNSLAERRRRRRKRMKLKKWEMIVVDKMSKIHQHYILMEKKRSDIDSLLYKEMRMLSNEIVDNYDKDMVPKAR
jgi:hypothetical protein